MCSKLYGILRFSEVINLKRSDVILKETHMSSFIEKSKTDTYQKGYWMHLSKLQSTIYPIKWFKSILKPQKLKNQERNLFLSRFVIVN